MGQPDYALSAGAGVEVYGGSFRWLGIGDLGWASLDCWSVAGSGVGVLDREHPFLDVTFLAGDRVVSHVEERFLRLREGLDIRYRFPLADETWLDASFGPTFALAFRFTSIQLEAQNALRAEGADVLAVTIVPGWRFGLDLHVPGDVTVRVGIDIDSLESLPRVLPHRGMSLTREPSVGEWTDLHVSLAARWRLAELAFGWRWFEVRADGGEVRQSDVRLDGLTATLLLRF